jgi:hypothetical protein
MSYEPANIDLILEEMIIILYTLKARKSELTAKHISILCSIIDDLNRLVNEALKEMMSEK